MSNLVLDPSAESCLSDPARGPVFEELPGRVTDLGGLAIRRLLPRSQRRLVGPWCFLDSYGPLTFRSGKPMDVAPHPHIGLQTVSWLLDGEVMHNDSLGRAGLGRPGVLNLMTAGRGITHAEETPSEGAGTLRGVQLWVALPDRSRATEPAFEQHADLPSVDLPGAHVKVIMGTLFDERSRASTFSPIVAAEVTGRPGRSVVVPLDKEFEHAVVLLQGNARFGDARLAVDSLYYIGSGRADITLAFEDAPDTRVLLIGGAPLGEDILMWWNFVARSTDEIAAAREDWIAGRRFGEVTAYAGDRLPAPAFVARPVRRS